MKIRKNQTRRALVAILGALALAGSAGAQTATTAREGGYVPGAPGGLLAPSDDLRVGGCSGCFATQANAALYMFSNVTRVWRLCAAQSPSVATAGPFNVSGASSDQCDGNGKGRYQDYIVIQGDLKNSSTADFFNNSTGAAGADGTPDGLGVVGGKLNVTVRVSANGSGRGNESARTAVGGPKQGIGYVAPEGFDGIAGTADDGGGTGAFGGVSAAITAANAPGPNAPLPHVPAACAGADTGLGTADDKCAPTVDMRAVSLGLGGTGDIVDPKSGATKPLLFDRITWPAVGTTWAGSGSAGRQIAIVEYDRNNNGSIDNADRGAGGYWANGFAGQDCLTIGDCDATRGPNGAGTVGSSPTGAATESTNLSMFADHGCMDLPSGDFHPTARPPVQDETRFGAQIMKLLVTKDVRAQTQQCFNTATNRQVGIPCDTAPNIAACGALPGHACQDAKVALYKEQIENIFGDGGATSVCKWEAIGAVGTPGGAPFTGSNINLALRVFDSGTRNTFTENWMLNTDGTKNEFRATPAPPGPSPTPMTCAGVPSPNFAQKRYSEYSTGDGVENGMASGTEKTNGVGYVDVDRTCGTGGATNCYDAVIAGVDPETNDMKTLVKCGMYHYWGPLSCGTGRRNGNVASATLLRYQSGLSSVIPYFYQDSYLAKNGVAFWKLFTDGPTTQEFVPTGCPAQPNAPARKPL